MTDDVILFKTDDGQIKLDVRFENETVWLTRTQMAALFERDVKTIGKQIEKNGERMAQAQDAPYRPAPPKGTAQRSAVPPRRPMPPPDVPDAACVVCDNTGEDHFAHDKAQRIAQLDEFLKNGIIDKAEYRTLRERYERGL